MLKLVFIAYLLIVLIIWLYENLKYDKENFQNKENFKDFILSYLVIVFILMPLYFIIEIVVRIVNLYDK